MNNARCKSIVVAMLLLTSSIAHICARDNDQLPGESLQHINEPAAQENAPKQAAPIAQEDLTSTQSSIDSSEEQEEPKQTSDVQDEDSDEQDEEDTAELFTGDSESQIEPAQEPQQKTEPLQDFTMPSPSEDDAKALQDALSKDIGSISTDKNIQELLNQATNEMLEAYNEATINQLQQLDCILEEIATNLSSNTLIQTRNRPAALQKIKSLRNDSDYLKTVNIVPLNANTIFIRAQQIHDLADYARTNLEKGIDQCELYNLSTFNPQELKNTEDVEEQLKKAIIENNQALEALRSKAARIGLHYYNIAWRWMHRNVFDPWKKYHMTQASLGATWVTTAAFFTWYYFGGKTIPGLPARFGTWLRDKVGWPAQSPDDYIINDPNSTMAANQYILDELEKAGKNSTWRKSGLSKEDIDKILYEASKKVQDGPHANMQEALNRPVGWLGRLEHRISQFLNNKFMVGTLVLAPTGNLLLSTVAPALATWMSRTTQKIDNFMLGGVYRSKKTDDIIFNSAHTFDDVIGNEPAKGVFSNIIEYFKNPEAWERMHIAPKTGILLYGPTRAGKSFIIDAFLGELLKEFGQGAGFKILPISGSLIFEKGIDWVLDQAREIAPCIVVIEEIDLLGLQRAENKQLLASFMTAMNSCLQNNSMDKTVIVIGTTNKLENIELALRQLGRFGTHLYFQYPSHDERKLYINRELGKLAVMAEQFDIERLACLTEGCCYEQISDAMIKGALTEAKTKRTPISQNSLEESLERHVYGISTESCKIDEKQKRRIATHLAGEIVATQLLDPNVLIAKATIKDVRAKIEEQLVYFQYLETAKQNPVEYGKVFYCHDHDVLPLNSKEEAITQCKIYRAGHTAEALILGSSSSYHASDKQRAYEFALSAVGEGFDISKLPSAAQNQFFDQAYKSVSQCETDIRLLLEEHRDEIIAIANLLIEKQTIGQAEVDNIIQKTESTKQN